LTSVEDLQKVLEQNSDVVEMIVTDYEQMENRVDLKLENRRSLNVIDRQCQAMSGNVRQCHRQRQ
jgi:hypothetical protein